LGMKKKKGKRDTPEKGKKHSLADVEKKKECGPQGGGGKKKKKKCLPIAFSVHKSLLSGKGGKQTIGEST